MPARQPSKLTEFETQARLASAVVTSEDSFQGVLEADLKAIRSQIDPADDIVAQSVPEAKTPSVIIFQQGLVDVPTMVPPVVKYVREGKLDDVPSVKTVSSSKDAVSALLQGDAILLVNGSQKALVLPFPAKLQPNKPLTDRVVRGPHEAFTSQLAQNLALLRNLVQLRTMRVELFALVPDSEAKVALCYVAGSAPPSVRDEILERLQHVQTRSLVDVTALKLALADDSWSPFVNVQLTERVDTVAVALIRGRYGLFLTGAEQALIAPATFIEMMNPTEDRYLPRFLANTSRVIRWGSLFIALLLESVYIAVTQVHQELLPTPLAFAIARSRIGVPLPVFAEVIVMALIIEVLREAAIRLPGYLSQTISIVGALVIGQAVVQASLISAPVIVLVAVVALASFTVPQYELALTVRFLRFPAMFGAAMLGLFGVTTYVLLLLIHMTKLRSFGVAFLSPLAPFHMSKLPRLFRWPMRAGKPELP